MNIEAIESLYNAGCWSKENIKQLVTAGVITEQQYYTITGATPEAAPAAPTAPAAPANNITAAEGIAKARG